MKTTRKNLVISRPVEGRGFFSPRYSPGFHRFVKLVSRGYLNLVEGVSAVELEEEGHLIDSFRKFQQGQSRLIILFRHPSRWDPPVLAYALNNLLPRAAKNRGTPLPGLPHAQFLYGKDVLNWAGPAAVIAFPRLGHIPVQNLGTNKEGMNLLRRELTGSRFPIALAPESQVTYHVHQCAPLAQGFTSMAQWTLEAGQEVLILPVALGYRYPKPPGEMVEELLGRWETEAGNGYLLDRTGSLEERLMGATNTTLTILESFYRLQTNPADEIVDRRRRICHSALKEAESLFHLPGRGTVLDRVFQIRYTAMGRLYPEGENPREHHSLNRAIFDFRTLEAKAALRHNQIVDVLEYLDPSYIDPCCDTTRACEYVLNLLDILNRLRGGDISSRYHPRGVTAVVRAGEPLDARTWLGANPGKASRLALHEEIGARMQTLSEELLF
jgi:hypothetical protein